MCVLRLLERGVGEANTALTLSLETGTTRSLATLVRCKNYYSYESVNK